jgi:hypothetical protein
MKAVMTVMHHKLSRQWSQWAFQTGESLRIQAEFKLAE